MVLSLLSLIIWDKTPQLSNSILLWQDETGQNQCIDGDCIRGKGWQHSCCCSTAPEEKALLLPLSQDDVMTLALNACGYLISEPSADISSEVAMLPLDLTRLMAMTKHADIRL